MITENEKENYTGTEIAVIGMAGRYPGAPDIHRFWENLIQGKETVRYFSDDELIEAGASPELLKRPNYVKAKGTLDDVEYFDASFFNYTRAEAEFMDPQLRILHETSWAALEDAGYDPEQVVGLIGYYIGASTHLYWIARMLNYSANLSENFAAIAVNDGYSFSTQIAYRLNLKGPAITMQTACSTSLVAIHTAAQALLSGECDMALAGGIAVTLPGKSGYLYQEGMVYSPDGHCRPFAAAAAGSLNGNGVGIVVLKPLENAREDRDHIYALVKGTAVNNDGNRKIGYSAPSVKGQAEVIRIAQQAADVEPESITYIEAHGTGTTLGDPVEIRALTQAFATEKKQYCRIGSVKSNMGHLDAAAGVTGFIKTVLALKHRQIPPTLHFDKPNPEIDFANSPFIVNTELYDWQSRGNPLRAGVSSFGIGGTNAHVILEEPPQPTEQPGEETHTTPETPRLILLSARSAAALERNTQNLVEFFNQHPNINLADAAYTLQVGRKSFEHRRALLSQNPAEAARLLSTSGTKKIQPTKLAAEKPFVVFVFPGLGGQYVNMGHELYRTEPLFRQELDHCFDLLKPLMGFDIKEILYPSTELPLSESSFNDDTDERNIHRPEISQLVIFSYEYALARLLEAWGITPDAMIGYSFGEYTAACIAGVFTLEDVIPLIIQRGQLIKRTQPGGMLSVPYTKEQLQPILRENPGNSLAIDNGSSCIVSGPAQAVDALAERLKENKTLSMRLTARHALHSPMMNSILPEFTARVREIALKKPVIPYISNVTGQWQTDRDAQDPAYWAGHLSGTVQFSRGIEELTKEPQVIFLELGPGREMTTMIQRYLGKDQHILNVVSPRQKQIPENVYLLERLGRLWQYGQRIDWQTYYAAKNERRNRISLPTYSFEKQRYNLGEGEVQAPPEKQGESAAPKAMAATRYKRADLPEDYEAPRDTVEEAIASAMQSIFAIEPIGIHEDFFELGGDSLKVITLVTRLHREVEVEIPMEVVFKRPTIKELAEYVREKTEKHVFMSIPPVEMKEYYPLSPSQRRIFILDQLEDNNMAYNMPTVLWMEGTPDIPRLSEACRQLLERHETLRTAFFLKETEPVQRVYPPGETRFELEYFDYSKDKEQVTPRAGADRNDKRYPAEEIKPLIDDFVQSFNLSEPPLWRVRVVKLETRKYLLMQNIHHIITDDISTGIMISELSVLYRGETGTLPPLPVQYKDYAAWQRQTAAERILKQQQEFWRILYSTPADLPLLQMPCDHPRPPVWSNQGAHIQLTIDVELTAKLHQLANKNKTTLFVLLFTIYNTLLYSYTGQEDIIIGTPITGRSHRDVQPVAGMFVNTLALRNHPKGDKPFTAFLEEVKTSTLEAFSNQMYQFDDLVELLNLKRDMSRNPLFDTMFVLHTVDLGKVNIPGVKLYPYEYDTPVSRYDLTLNAAETVANEINLVLEYSTALFETTTVQRFMTDLLTVMETLVIHPETALGEIQTSATHRREEERKRILYEFNDTQTDYPRDKTLNALLEEQAMRSPDRAALTAPHYAGGTRGIEGLDSPQLEISPKERITVTFGALNGEAHHLALRLRANGAVRGTVIALICERSVEMIIGLLAIIKAGAAYLPIGPEYPADRIRYMVEQTQTPIILTTERTLPFQHTAQLLDIPEAIASPRQEPAQLPSGNIPSDLAYIIYTSGTTGKPKGVMIEQRSVVNFITGITDIIPFTCHDHIYSLTTLAFDIFGLETLLPLTKGTRVIIGGIEEQLDAASAAAVLEKEKITIFQVTPSRLKLFMTQPATSQSLMHLKYLLIGGEALSLDLLEKARAMTQGKIYNLYGPTETTIWSTIKEVSAGMELNIGKPIANTQVYIVDPAGSGRIQPLGVAGELLIGGEGVARGYLNNPELTSEKFLFDIHWSDMSSISHQPYSKFYKTGDLARWQADGNIEFLGRVDHQVKIRGNRVEPGEIEHRLVTHQAIKEAVVLVKNDETGDVNLWAYLETVINTQLEIPSLREYLSGELPEYMIPSYFVQIPQIPLTPNGKIDRKALADMKGTLLTASTTVVEPQNPLEETIAHIWRSVLNLEKVSIDDNFLDLGGTSLKVILAVSQLKSRLNTNIPVVTMFRYPTIRTLANYLGSRQELPTGKDRGDIKAKGRERMNLKRRLKETLV